MSCRVEAYNTVQKLGQELILLQCGLTVCDSGHRCGPVSYENYAIHFGLEGKLRYAAGGREYAQGPGEGFLILPNQLHTYVADAEEPCTFLYMVFRGEGTGALMERIGLSADSLTFRFPREPEYLENLREMHREAGRRVSGGLGMLACFLAALDGLIPTESKQKASTPQSEYIRRAKTFIRQHYAYHLTVEDVALHVGLERTYLYRLFVSECGVSPGAYLRDLRLQKASELLRETDMTVTAIALSCGFCDFSHFSHRFSEKYGLSPGAYRKTQEA